MGLAGTRPEGARLPADVAAAPALVVEVRPPGAVGEPVDAALAVGALLSHGAALSSTVTVHSSIELISKKKVPAPL